MSKHQPPAFKLEEDITRFECRQDLTLAKTYLAAAAPHAQAEAEGLDLVDTAALIDREILRVKIEDGERWRIAVLEKAVEELTECRHSCWCVHDDWDQALVKVNDQLEKFWNHLWAVVDGPEFDKSLRVVDLAEYLTGGADEPTRIKVDWDGSGNLLVEIGTTENRYSVRLQPLDDLQERAYELWIGDDPWLENGLRKVKDLPRNTLLAAYGLADQQRYHEDVPWGFGNVLGELEAAGMASLDEGRQEVVARLAPEWAGTPAALVETARAV